MLKTVINMLPKEQMRAAGLTALGKIIEFNLDSLASKCSESVWMELEQALQHVCQVPSLIMVFVVVFTLLA